jgi:hypothetical protein
MLFLEDPSDVNHPLSLQAVLSRKTGISTAVRLRELRRA